MEGILTYSYFKALQLAPLNSSINITEPLKIKINTFLTWFIYLAAIYDTQWRIYCRVMDFIKFPYI